MISKLPLVCRLPLLLFFVLLLFRNGTAQNSFEGRIIAFHPSAGNTITLKEKKEFGIFPEYNDSLFESAVLIQYDSSKYVVKVRSITGSAFERTMSQPELDAIYKKIESVKPFASIVTPAEDDYVVNANENSKEKDVRKKRNENAYIVAEISLQVLFVFLEILANIH